ncbi:hypothetical protein D9M71_816300 [compost metagenome]
MSFHTRSKSSLIEILEAGASLSLIVGTWIHSEWVELATAAKTGGGHLTIKGVGVWNTRSLVLIAQAGRGHVTFLD